MMDQVLKATGAAVFVLIAFIAIMCACAWIKETWDAITNYPKAKALAKVIEEQREELQLRSFRIRQLETELADKFAANVAGAVSGE